MRHVVISSRSRPHWNHESCWCKPVWIECMCDNNCGRVLGHNLLDLYEDDEPRMSVYSEQFARGMAPEATG